MKKARFTFKKFKNSYLVKIENLEDLSVNNIKKIQKFVENRNGVFDFNKYEFVIQKRLDFDEFSLVIKKSDIDAIITEKLEYKDALPRVGFGKYKGMLYQDIPSSYLLWLKNNYFGADREDLERELSTRRL